MTILFGSRVRISGQFKTPAGVLLDPAVFKLTVVTPRGTLSFDPTMLVKDGVGQYHYDLIADFIGSARFRWDSTGAGQESADEGGFTVVVGKVK